MTRAEILQETVEYYTKDVKRRAYRRVDYVMQCRYLVREGDVEFRCAVGRCMTPDAKLWSDAAQKFFTQEDYRGGAWHIDNLDDVLQARYRGHPAAFWHSLQYWHDTRRFWKHDGLTAEGLEHVEGIRRGWCGREDSDPLLCH
jgi:hypothetical protein